MYVTDNRSDMLLEEEIRAVLIYRLRTIYTPLLYTENEGSR